MTPAELRALADEATPGPWHEGVTPGYLSALQEHHVATGRASGPPLTLRSPAHTEEIATVWNYLLPTEANACLIALAPDLARLCAEMGEALEDSIALVRSLRPDLSYTRTRADKVVASNRAALAKLAALEAR